MNTPKKEIAHRKRRIERLLRGIGFSRVEAKRGAARLSARLIASASFACLAAWNVGLR